ncbi:hypothetical protein SAMN05421853_1312 [Roseivivax halotolerans]|uniref:DUF5681 domain-containing protein n=1 Tax=Roseivivax halotolerans TaxID=93684 RepID=A0A1I6APL8_9RHOB|nr:DUF5681 domain-containing protein [Roseivivax halotolerans]SFQ70562.1 hypothetical protein SAMN05421853_1312 [Roseivivax halotolerans]
MSKREHNDNYYEVGYGRPPKATQFKKGQSGNPKGRPKGAKGLIASLRRELEQHIIVREGGRELRISKADATAKQLVNKAMTGDSKAIIELIKLDPQLFGDLVASPTQNSVEPDPVDLDILRDFLSQSTGYREDNFGVDEDRASDSSEDGNDET